MTKQIIMLAFFLIVGMSCKSESRQNVANTTHGEVLSVAAVERQATDSLCAAWMKVSEVMPPLGGDSEADWAADTIKTIGNELLRSEGSNVERLSKIYVMQSLFAYGMNYFRSTISLYTDHAELSSYALHGPSFTEDDYHKLDSLEFKDLKTYISLATYSQFYTQLIFPLFQIANRDEKINFGPLGSSFNTQQITDSLLAINYSEKDIIKVHTVLDAADFFQSVCLPIQYTTMSDERRSQLYDSIIECATYFDNHAEPIKRQFCEDPSKVKALDDKEYREFLSTATRYKCMLLDMLTENFVECAKMQKQ